MKKYFFLGIVLSTFFIACSKKEQATMQDALPEAAHYDTTAIDSFSPGATSVDVVEQIRMSSQKYQDSVKAALLKMEEDEKLKQEIEKENKKKAAEEKEKQKSAGTEETQKTTN